MSSLRPRTIDDLNPVLVRQNPERAKAMLDAANLINDYYANHTIHRFAIGDCLLGKLNYLKANKRIRKNPGMR